MDLLPCVDDLILPTGVPQLPAENVRDIALLDLQILNVIIQR